MKKFEGYTPGAFHPKSGAATRPLEAADVGVFWDPTTLVLESIESPEYTNQHIMFISKKYIYSNIVVTQRVINSITT